MAVENKYVCTGRELGAGAAGDAGYFAFGAEAGQRFVCLPSGEMEGGPALPGAVVFHFAQAVGEVPS